MDDLVGEFLGETTESLSELDTQLVTLEQDPENKEIIDSIFRVMHTIKGTCGFLGLHRLESVAHAGEDVLDNIRNGKLQINQEIITVILESIDRIKDIIEVLEQEGTEPEDDDTDLITKLKAYAEGDMGDVTAKKKQSPPPEAPNEEEQATDSDDLQALFDAAPGPGEEAAGGDSDDLQALFDSIPGPQGSVEAETPPAAPPFSEPAKDEKDDIPSEAKKVALDKGLETAKSGAVTTPSSAHQSIRVNLHLLENLMQMASELVLTRNQLTQVNRKIADSAFATPLQRLSNITTDIQENVMKTRMQPIGNAWAKFPRLLRDLAVELNKKIELKMVGGDTELDRQMLEMVKDPLTHMVRNAADHGLDTPEERLAAGKDETGTITLSSYHEGGHIIVRISDDGRGIDVDKVSKKAIENGLTTEAEVSHLTKKQIFQFILKPGFSTADEITSVSGRGVGMDVVVSNIESIGGTLEVDSVPGKGSDFTIKLPLTLAIMSVLVVESRGINFAIPQIRVSEIVRAIDKSVTQNTEKKEDEFIIEIIKETPVLRLRGKLLPLVELDELLQLSEKQAGYETVEKPVDTSLASADITQKEGGKIAGEREGEAEEEKIPSSEQKKSTGKGKVENKKFVVVCEVGSSYFGITVDKVFDTEEIVVKPKSSFIKDIEIYSGCTILGDGSVIMILDPNGIMKTMGDIAPSTTEEELSAFELRAKVSSDEEQVNFLLFKAGGKAPKAVPLELVSRLEEIDMSKIEWAGDKQVVQYREHLMRLITTDDSYSIPSKGISEVIVFSDEGKILGLVIEKVHDITQHRIDIRSISGEHGILGSMVIEGVTYDLIDVGYYFSDAFSDWLANKPDLEDGPETRETKHRNLLLVDDSPFFRKFMTPILVVADYNVTTVDSAVKAMKILEEGGEFDAIITDIEMPEMTGIEFVKACRENEKYSAIPFIALTSFSNEDIMAKDEDAGFNGFVSKSDRDKLIDTISDVLSDAIEQQKEAS